MKTNFRLTLPLLALAATAITACSDDENMDNPNRPDPNKDLIDFTSNGGETATRASFADTRAGFAGATNIVMRIKAQNGSNTRYTRTIANAAAQTSADDAHNATGLLGASFTHSDVSFTAGNFRYWDDAFGRDSKLSIYAIAVPNKTELSATLLQGGTAISTENPNWFNETTENETVEWSVTTGEQTTATIAAQDLCYSNNIRYGATDSEKGVYRSTYDNGSWTESLVAGQMQWSAQAVGSTTGKFDKGHLIFKHALCKITINLTEGNGFNHSITTDFAFPSSSNVSLLGFPTTGTLNLADATWADYASTAYNNITKILASSPVHNAVAGGTNTVHTLTALVLPNRVMKDETANAISFEIDGNKYYVNCNQIATKIREYAAEDGNYTDATLKNRLLNFSKMQQGDHYVINITVGKKQIDNITAALVAWEEIGTTQIDPTNTFINFTLEDRSPAGNNSTVYDSDDAAKFALYRAANESLDSDNNPVIYEDNTFVSYDWKTGYNGPATKTWNSTLSRWETDWFWPNNSTYYHIRAIGDANASTAVSMTVNTDETNGDNFVITSGNLSGSDYKDYIWGAPFTDVATIGENGSTVSYKFVYTPADGFNKQTTDGDGNITDSQIYKAIGPTNSKISMVLFHMTSQIYIDVTTTTGEDRVVLGDENNGTKVELLRFYKDGSVLMGTGKVAKTSEDITLAAEIANYEYTKAVTTGTLVAGDSKFSYGVVPQDSSIGLCITTKDGNKYYVNDLSKILATTVSNKNLNNPYSKSTEAGHTDEYVIDKWYPGYQYTYTVVLSKTGIKTITASLVDWETVTGNIGNITLEN